MKDRAVAEERRRFLEEFPVLAALDGHEPREIDELFRMVRGCREYSRLYVLPRALDLDRQVEMDPDYFDWDLMKAACRYRFFSWPVPKAMGGLAGKYMVTNVALAMEELCTACAGVAMNFAAHSLGASPLICSGAMAHWNSLFPEILEGERE